MVTTNLGSGTDVTQPTLTGAAISRFVETLRGTQFMAPERLVAYQRGLLEPLVRHARMQVPFYRDSGRLDPLFARGDVIDWDRWSEIPVLTRGEVQRAGDQLRAAALGPEHGGVFQVSTSGSTGEPVTVAHSQLSRCVAWIAVLLRDYERHGIDATRRLVHLAPQDPASFDLAGAPRSASWYPEFAELGLDGERFDIADTRPIRDITEAILALRPDYLRVQPIVLELLCAHDDQRRLGALGLRAITAVGEHLSSVAKANAERHFGCRVLDHYGSNECGRMASTCAICGRYHVHAEAAVVEVIDQAGAVTPPGEVGRVIVTPLYNYAMPLIRYDHVDQARVGRPGKCPITLPVLDEVFGKERTPFVFPGGIVIRPTLPVGRVVELIGASAYQVAQVAPDRCEFRFVPGDRSEAALRFDEMTALLRILWWERLEVTYRAVSELPRAGPYGKVVMFVREMPDASSD